MKKIGLRIGLALASLICQNTASAAVTQNKGRIVVFADKKAGDFKTDKSIKMGTTESLENLKLAQSDQKNIHTCFVGSSADIKPILNTMISNTKNESKEGLKLKTFATEGHQSSIHIEVISGESKSTYLSLNIDPC